MDHYGPNMTKTLFAKPIIQDKYWIVTDGTQKVGNIIVMNNDVNFSINNTISSYSDIKSIKNNYNISFESHSIKESKSNPIYKQYPVDGEMHNIIVDVKRKIQLYTKTPYSKCYYAAGYFNINMDNNWESHFCPKYIYIQRYPYNGPYTSLNESEKVLGSL